MSDRLSIRKCILNAILIVRNKSVHARLLWLPPHQLEGKLLNKIRPLVAAAVSAAFGFSAAVAQADDGWTGEGSLSAGVTTGNTDTQDVGLGVALSKKAGVWTYGGQAGVDYGKLDGVESKNRIFLAGNIDRQLNDRLFAFGKLTHERDEFTAYTARSFVGGGLGYQVYDTDKTKWNVRGGPGIKIDEARDVTAIVNGIAVNTPGETETSAAIFLGSTYEYVFNENVSLSNLTDVTYARDSTQISNSLGVTAKLGANLSGRVSYDVRHDTNPLDGFESTDTATRISLVYGF